MAVDAQDWVPFVPLGQMGGGDLYAFCPSLATHVETPVTFSWHDANETTVLASSLEAFISRQMLDQAIAFDEDDLQGYASFDELRTDLQRAALIIRPYMAYLARSADGGIRPTAEAANHDAATPVVYYQRATDPSRIRGNPAPGNELRMLKYHV